MERSQALRDLVWLAVTAGVNVAGEMAGMKAAVVAVAAAFWLVRLGLRLRIPGTARAWGLHGAGWRWAVLLCAAASLIGTIGLVLLAGGDGPLVDWRLAALVPVYFPWALAQQVLLCAVLARSLEVFLPGPAVAFAAGLLFACAHLPDLPLSVLTLFGGVMWVAVYRKWPNLWVLAVSHAFLGSFVYLYVLGRDPLSHVFGG